MSWFPKKEQGETPLPSNGHKVGERVGAILKETDTHLYLIGYGVLEDNNIFHPRIKIDGGRYVCGCQCWWGSEDSIRKRGEQRIVEDASHIAKLPVKGH